MLEQVNKGEDRQMVQKKSDWLIVLGVQESCTQGEVASSEEPTLAPILLEHRG